MPTYLAKPVSPRWQPGHPLGNGLKFFLPVHGPSDVASARDCAGGLVLSAVGGSKTGQGGIICNGSGKGFEAILPDHLKLQWPVTIACQVKTLGAATSNANYFGLLYDNAGTSPFYILQLIRNSSGNFAARFSYGAFTGALTSTVPALRVGVTDILACVFGPDSQALYLNGTPIASGTTSYDNPIYTSTSLVAAGDFSGSSRAPNWIIEGAAIWNQALTPTQVSALNGDFFAPVRPRSSLALWAAAAVGGTSPAAFQAGWAAYSNQFIGGGC